jgi:hypothetical protein
MAPRAVIRLALGTAVCLSAGALVRAHDVTTRITWNREVSRIVYARCASCHRPGGAAFSLLTYQEANPWAVAIKDSVLRRTMPPWGAVKGFGGFRNEQALSQEELGLIENWVNGGTPEGNPNDLPPRARIAAPLNEPSSAGTVTVSGDYTFVRALTLDGFRPSANATIPDAQITIAFPDGRVTPLVWLHDYSLPAAHAFLLRTPLSIPAGATLRGLPPGASLELLLASPTSAAR